MPSENEASFSFELELSLDCKPGEESWQRGLGQTESCTLMFSVDSDLVEPGGLVAIEMVFWD